MPGWVPVYNLNLTEDRVGYVAAPDHALSYPWTHLISGHVGRLGTRDDVKLHQQYIADISEHARARARDRRPDPVLPKVRRERVGGGQGLSRRGHEHRGRTRHREVHRGAGRRPTCSPPTRRSGCSNRSASTSVSVARSTPDGRFRRDHRRGRLGQALARTARRADRPVVIANSRGPDSLSSVVDTLGPGVNAGTTGDAARCSIVALAVPWAGSTTRLRTCRGRARLSSMRPTPCCFPASSPCRSVG